MLRSFASARRVAPRLLQRRLQSTVPPPPPVVKLPPAPPHNADLPLAESTPVALPQAEVVIEPRPVVLEPLAPPPLPPVVEVVPPPTLASTPPPPAPLAEPKPAVAEPAPAPPPPPPPHGPPAGSRIKSLLLSTALFAGTSALLLYAYDTRAGIHRWLTLPAFLALTQNDPEYGHQLGVKVLASGLAPVDCGVDDERLAFELWGKKFSNPVGIAAGFDKHAEAIDGLFNLGFGYVEVGSVTPEPQDGNPRPRVFRVPESKSVINRYGFNSEGHTTAVGRLRARVRKFVQDYASVLPAELFPTPPSSTALAGEFDPVEAYLASPASSGAAPVDAIGLPRSLKEGRVLGLNLGKNKVSDPDSIEDFVKGIVALGPYADVVVINVSSPNTPGLRNLQRKGMLSELLEGVVQARNLLPTSVKPPILVKVAPDLDDEQISDIAFAATNSGIDGVIVSNTTISRPASAGSSPVLREVGGLSGPPVKALALRALSALYEQTDGKIPLVGCGGISSGQDALDYAKAGASLVQLYTGFVYGGVGLPRQIKDELTALLAAEGKSWKDVIGAGRVKKVAPVPQAAQEVKHLGDGLNEKPKPTEKEFSTELSSAKQELEQLLEELAHVSLPPTAGALPPSAATLPTEPVAVPAPVAESIPASSIASSPLTTPTPAPTPAPNPAPTPVVPAHTADFNAPAPPQPPHIVATAPAPKLEETPVAAAPALLDESAITQLLDPAAAQIKAGIAPPTKERVEADKIKIKVEEQKRWV